MTLKRLFTTIIAAAISLTAAGADVFTVEIKANDREGKPVAAAVVLLEPYGQWGMTGNDGLATIGPIPYHADAEYKISVSILGYKTWTERIVPENGKALRIKALLVEESIAMDEVVVVAESKKSGEATASKIGRMAIDHLQATSLNDLMQLIPGQVSMSNPTLTRASHFSMRTLYDRPDATSIVMDGVPVSSNSEMNGNEGVDLRSIGTDDLQSVEIIRGIASAEYGDVSSGTMIVNSKIGVTDLNLRAKIMPGIMQFYGGKGFKAGRAGNFNISADYARGKSDPRYHTDTYDRLLFNAAHNIQVLDGRWDMTTKLSLTGIKDWSGSDPAAPEAQRELFKERKTGTIRLNHSGRINVNCLFAGTVSYDLSYQNNTVRSRAEDIATMMSGVLFDATEEGLHTGLPLPRSYKTLTGVRSNPITWYAKVTDRFQLNKGRFLNHFNVGAEFRSEGNEGFGRYDESEIPAFAQDRLRRYKDIPYLNQFSLYAEDRFTIPLARKPYPNIKGQVGVRWTMIQPGRKEFMNSWSPRINLTLNITDWMSIRGGYGQSEKLPSLMQLYPDRMWLDWYSMAVSNGQDSWFMYSTRTEDISNPELRPMRNNKFEAGLDFRPHNGMSFSIVGFWETVRNGFGTDLSHWTAYEFPEWDASDVSFNGKDVVFDREHPSRMRTVIANIGRPGNPTWERNCGIEFDFDFGKIRATNTSFYLNGAYTHSSLNSKNSSYEIPIGKSQAYSNVWLVYPEGTGSKSERRQFSTALRIVQHIPAIRFIVSATAQFVFYDYDHRAAFGTRPVGYLTDDHHPENWTDGRSEVHYTAFTPEQYQDPTFQFEGFLLKDQIATEMLENLPTVWPPIWTLNLRVTKEIGDFMGFSFYVNNMLFHQPWQNTNTSPVPIERNGSLFSYGLELFLHF